jgi:serine/threonine-protein kinase RsbW
VSTTATGQTPTQRAMRAADPAPQLPDVVEILLPPDSAYLSVLRTATAGLAARLDFTLDDIEDLRIAVDEACAMLLPHALDGASLTCRFELHADRLDITVALPSRAKALPARDTFAWTVLSALAGEVDAGIDAETTAWISLHKRKGPVPA